MNSKKDNECLTPKEVDPKGHVPRMSSWSDRAEHNIRFQSQEEPKWVIREVKIKAKRNNKKRLSLAPRKKGN